MPKHSGTEDLSTFYQQISPRQPPDSIADAAPLPAWEPRLDEASLECSLLPFQRESVRWAVRREVEGPDGFGVKGGVLAEEMGLGKTIEVFCLVLSHPPPDDVRGAPGAVSGAAASSAPSSQDLLTPPTYHHLPLLSEALAPYHLRRGALRSLELRPTSRGDDHTGTVGAPCDGCGRRPLPHEVVHEAAIHSLQGSNNVVRLRPRYVLLAASAHVFFGLDEHSLMPHVHVRQNQRKHSPRLRRLWPGYVETPLLAGARTFFSSRSTLKHPTYTPVRIA